jgi:hypothetical protein
MEMLTQVFMVVGGFVVLLALIGAAAWIYSALSLAYANRTNINGLRLRVAQLETDFIEEKAASRVRKMLD